MNISTLIVAIKLKGEYKIKETVIYTYGGDSIVRMHFDGRFNIADMIVKRDKGMTTRLMKGDCLERMKEIERISRHERQKPEP